MEPKISIAIVKYKGLEESFFQKTLFSALSQIGVRYTITIYLDNAINNFKHPLITEIKIPLNLRSNPSKIREFIISNTKSEYLAFFDSDDIYTSDRIYKQTKSLIEQQLDLCFSNFLFFNETEIFTLDYLAQIGFKNRQINIFDENYFGFGIMTAKVDFLKRLLPFPEVSTLDWWIAIKCTLLNAKIKCLHDIHGYYRLYSHSQSKKFDIVELPDFIQEKQTKLSLYSLFPEVSEIVRRKEFIENLDVVANYQDLKEKYVNLKYKNVWGGLIKYETK